ncbi:MAG: 6-hydroxycyclohex-1-ene-1-carbonyl-CoA dehydrogenase [Chloroflexi bacterium]|nr:6-hydroxycyclohex-1-ene-1-carbonyl-CoA dehydrogenase [Chloroflexota bacterium]MBU1747693.1 6-hydroxycyclohex-1-ene-1-carbonyl-CoA dehydrogenase [Chloroflexota bacterium]
MVQPWTRNKETGEKTPGKLERTSIPVPELQPGEVLVEIAGCGVCHTDLGYFYHGVPTVNKPPLTLGHEISGRVVAGEANWIGKEVIVPAVMPCNDCPICAAGRGNRCLAQKMPGNSLGIYGGFSSHIPVPAADLCVVEGRGDMPLERLAVVADAVTTPYQATQRADLQAGDRVIVVGAAGGVGTHVVQIAKALGAGTVVGIDIDQAKLERILDYGADFVINSAGKSVDEVRGEFRALCKEQGLPHNFGWKIFEVTGARPGQEISLALLSFIGKLIWIGFSTNVNEYSLSRLMAFDAEIIGTWGCLPKHYPAALQMVLDGRIQIEPFVETRPMSTIREAFEEAHAGQLTKRLVLVPDF